VYTAVIECDPAVSELVEYAAIPPLNAVVPNAVEPSMKTTFPVGVPALELTVAVKTTELCAITVLALTIRPMAGAPCVAVPLSGNTAEIPPSAVMFMLPARNPYPVGAKRTVMVQLACAAKVAGQVVVNGNSATLVSPIARFVNESAVPVFVKVMVWPVLGVPIDVTAKLNWGIDKPRPGGMAEAETATTPT
jgi:hypothetical protein